MTVKKEFPEWIKTLYRGVRAGVSAGIVAVMALKLDLSDPQETMKVVFVVFGTGFVVSFGKWLRELLDAKFGVDANSFIAKMMPF